MLYGIGNSIRNFLFQYKKADVFVDVCLSQLMLYCFTYFSQSLICSYTPAPSSLYFSSSFTAGPDSPNTSYTPIFFTGVGSFSLSTSQTALPRPPMTECSSAVTTLPVFFADVQDDLLVQRLDGVDIDHLCVDTLCRQLLSCFQSAVYTEVR